MGSCYIYQPQYLAAALGRTNGLPIGDAITGSVGGGAGVLRGYGDLARSTPGKIHLPKPPPQGLLCCRLTGLDGAAVGCAPYLSWEESPRNLSQKPPQSPCCLLPSAVFFSTFSGFLY